MKGALIKRGPGLRLLLPSGRWERRPAPRGVRQKPRSASGLVEPGFFLESIFQDPCPALNGTRRATMPQVLTRRSEPITLLAKRSRLHLQTQKLALVVITQGAEAHSLTARSHPQCSVSVSLLSQGTNWPTEHWQNIGAFGSHEGASIAAENGPSDGPSTPAAVLNPSVYNIK